MKSLSAHSIVFLLCWGLAVSQVVFSGNGNNNNNRRQSSNTFSRASAQQSFVTNSNRRSSTNSRSCTTVSGPNPRARCIFPFRYNGNTYNYCPIDPEDSTKTWCSTKVDSNGDHVKGQGQYGHCGPSCPKVVSTTGSSGSSSGSNNNNNNNGNRRPVAQSAQVAAPLQTANSCSGNEQCRSISVCAVRYDSRQIRSKSCTQSNGSPGLCCPTITTNRNRRTGILSVSTRGVSTIRLDRASTANAVDVGASFYSNVTRSMPRFDAPRTSGAWHHNQLQKGRKGTDRTQKLAIMSMEAGRQLKRSGRVANDAVLLRGADISGTTLDRECYVQPRCSFPGSKYRNIDGSCNNLNQPLYGQLLTPMQRVLSNDYNDGMNEPRQFGAQGNLLRSPRSVSTIVAGNFENFSPQFSVLLMTFGQFLDHDITHVPVQERQETSEGINCCTNSGLFVQRADISCFPIQIPQSDRFFRKECMNFVRSQSAPNFQCAPGATEQVNQITHWLDSSNVYGSSDEEARELRSFSGGRLRGQRLSSSNKEFLPVNDGETDCKGRSCFLAGDSRVNEQPNLAVMHTVFFREHNRVARELQNLNPRWSDEQLYQESKRIVNAEWQHIVYNEYLPILLGSNYMDVFGLWPLNQGYSSDYRGDFDPRITNEFATAAFRVGHTMIPSFVRMISRQGNRLQQEMNLSDLFFNVDLISRGNMDNLIKGMTLSAVEEPENQFTEEITNKLFDGALNGMDLLALNIQRGRDHGLPSYNEYRAICQVGRASSFNDLNNISPENVNKLRNAYNSVDDIDLFVGMVMERPAFNLAFVGATFLCLIGDQFARLKKGDRFFYDLEEQPSSFTPAQLNQIRQTSMARIFCDNSDNLSEMQPLAFKLNDGQVNALTSCNDLRTIPRMDLRPWGPTRTSNNFRNGFDQGGIQ